MNSFIKSNKIWLSLLVLAIIIIFLAFLFRPKSIDFKTNSDQAVKLLTDPSTQVAISELAGKQLIDIRSADLFAQGHPDQAINIPVRNLLDEESLELSDRLQKSGQTAVLYGSDELQTAAPCLLLQQMGYLNLRTLKGRFEITNGFKESDPASNEVMLLDVDAMKAKQEEKIPDAEIKKPQVIIPVRKQASTGGGC
jgi:rhodanese-related sulfurtransferase